MTDRQLMQQALDALNSPNFGVHSRAILALQERLAHCDRCGKRLGGEGDIHTCTPDPIGDAQSALIAQMAAQPEQEPVFDDADMLLIRRSHVKRAITCLNTAENADLRLVLRDLFALLKTPPAPVQTNCRHCGGPDNVLCAGQCKQSTPPAAAQPAQQEPVAWRLNGISSLGHGKVFGDWKSGKPPKDVADLVSVDKNWSLEFTCTTPSPVQKPVATMRMLHTYGDTTPPAAAPMTEFEEAVAAVDNTLHHAIDHWQNRALKAEAKLAQPEQEPVAIPDEVRKVAQAMKKDGYRGPLAWAEKLIDFVADYTPPAAAESAEWAKFLHYPDCWDTAAYPTLSHAVHETLACFDCGTCTPPAAQRPWVGLTDEEMYLNCPNWLSQEHCKVWIQQIEAKLKEKNT